MIMRDTKTKDSINRKRITVFKGRVRPQPMRDFPLSISIPNMNVFCYSSSVSYTKIAYRPILSLGCFNKQCPVPAPTLSIFAFQDISVLEFLHQEVRHGNTT